MIKITPNPTFTTDAEIHVAGASEPGKISITFKYLNPEQLTAWQKKYGGKPVNKALAEIIVDWAGPVNDDDSSIPYSVNALDKLIAAYQTAGQDISQAFLRELLGARRKNQKPPPDGGRKAAKMKIKIRQKR